MKTKLLTLVLFFILLLQQAFGQKTIKPDSVITFSILGGINLQNIYGANYSGENLNYDFLAGFQAGININVYFGFDLFFQPGLLIFAKGAKQEILSEQKRTTKLIYLEMPLNLLYRPQLGEGHILLGLGPYGALGIKGQEIESDDSTVPVKFLNKVDLDNPDFRYYKPFDGGINILCGYEMNNDIYFQLNTQLGLLKINSFLEGDKASKKNIGFGFSAGYRF